MVRIFALCGRARWRLRGRRTGCSAVRGYHSSDPRERPQVLQVEVFDFDSVAEVLLKLNEQLHELERVEDAGLEEIGVRGWNFDVEALDEQSAEAVDNRIRVGQVLLL